MALQHITPEQIAEKGVVSAPDTLTGTAQQNKAVFDRLVGELVAPAYNACVDKVNELEDQEAGIEEAEAVRVANENGRVSAETQRVDAESARVGAETARASAEASRASAEASRVSAEASRASAEASRVGAETARASAEASRASAESARASAETARVNAETARVSAEASRVSAESARNVFEQFQDSKGYVPGNKVAYQGSSYVNILACNGIRPTNETFWLLIAKKGDKGDTGNGIAGIAKTGTSGLVDTYTITFTDGTTSTFTVTNGEDGEDGSSPTITATKVGKVTTIYSDGVAIATINDGEDAVWYQVGYDGDNTTSVHSVYQYVEEGKLVKIKGYSADYAHTPVIYDVISVSRNALFPAPGVIITVKAISGVNVLTGTSVKDGTERNISWKYSIGAYTKPSYGIPKTDLASAVQTSLGKADSSVQNTMTATATGLSPGAVPTVSYDSTTNVLAFGIPRGDKGDPGATGAQGLPGADGANGQDGATWFAANDYPTMAKEGDYWLYNGWSSHPDVYTLGDVSELVSGQWIVRCNIRGAQGIQGIQGIQGVPGSKGDKGDKGDTGAQGPAGQNGTNGADGYTPVRGTDYWTAADIAAIHGYIDEQLGVIENGSY